jgi:hypothetical protein
MFKSRTREAGATPLVKERDRERSELLINSKVLD